MITAVSEAGELTIAGKGMRGGKMGERTIFWPHAALHQTSGSSASPDRISSKHIGQSLSTSLRFLSFSEPAPDSSAGAGALAKMSRSSVVSRASW